MVGTPVGQSSKHSPAHDHRSAPSTAQPPLPPLPPYGPQSDSAILLSETTTTRTEVVTTTTTTHVLSSPLWRKSTPQTRYTGTTDTHTEYDDLGTRHHNIPSGVFMIEKDLPPTPTDEPPKVPALTSVHSAGKTKKTPGNTSLGGSGPIPFPVFCSDHSDLTTQPTAVLALASLRAGLPNVLSQSPTPSPAPPRSAPHDSRSLSVTLHTTGSIRRTKSTQKLKDNLTQAKAPDTLSPSVTFQEGPPKRARGISLGASPLFSSRSSDSSKRRDSGLPTSPNHTIPRFLARKTSFWLKRKTGSPIERSDACFTRAQLSSSLPPLSPPAHVEPLPAPLTPLHTGPTSRSHSIHARTGPSTTGGGQVGRRPVSAGGPLTSSCTLAHRSSSPVSKTRSIASFEQAKRPPVKVPPTAPRNQAQINPSLIQRMTLKRPSSSSSIPSRGPSSSPLTPNEYPRVSSFLFPNSSKTPGGETRTQKSSERSWDIKQVSVALVPGVQESPDAYLRRLQATVNRAEVGGILASSPDSFHVEALRAYMGRFDFVGDPLDVALRKLLMEIGLPRETQQIDRVIEAFARRYSECNPGLFTNEDHPYILAFSLIMLHTDAFNKSNKRKMTKVDYIKNTKLPGVSVEALDCFYDNIVLAPFIFVEDPLDVNGQRKLAAETLVNSVWPPAAVPGVPGSPRGISSIRTKIDPYYLITNRLLESLRIDTTHYIPSKNPYCYEGNAGPWDEIQLRLAFARAREVEFGGGDPSRTPTRPADVAEPALSLFPPANDVWTLKVTKAGSLNRKDDILAGGKRTSNRRWRAWHVILTGSQLLFFREAFSLLAIESIAINRQATSIYKTTVKPDELLSVKDAIAVFDKTYTKHDHTFRFVLGDGRQLLLQAPDRQELNTWISRINYASAFKSAGVRMRPLEMSTVDVKLTGVAAATSHLHDIHCRNYFNTPSTGSRPSFDLDCRTNEHFFPQRNVAGHSDFDADPPTAPEIAGAEQFKATFDEVKLDLAERHYPLGDPNKSTPIAKSNRSGGLGTGFPSRGQIIQSKIDDINSRLAASKSQLDSDMRFIRNIATLTPFQSGTRDRLVLAAQGIAPRIAQVRMEITKLSCHRHVLLSDLSSESRSWKQNKATALQAAKETLQSCAPASSPHLPYTPPPFTADSLSPRGSRLDSRPESSTCESFHSALDFGLDCPTAGCTISLCISPGSRSPQSCDKGDNHSPDSTLPPLIRHSLDDVLPDPADSPHFFEGVHASLWNPEEITDSKDSSRRAQRVSLVRVPSGVQLMTLFQDAKRESRMASES